MIEGSEKEVVPFLEESGDEEGAVPGPGSGWRRRCEDNGGAPDVRACATRQDTALEPGRGMRWRERQDRHSSRFTGERQRDKETETL